jgi:hypothetical protein
VRPTKCNRLVMTSPLKFVPLEGSFTVSTFHSSWSHSSTHPQHYVISLLISCARNSLEIVLILFGELLARKLFSLHSIIPHPVVSLSFVFMECIMLCFTDSELCTAMATNPSPQKTSKIWRYFTELLLVQQNVIFVPSVFPSSRKSIKPYSPCMQGSANCFFLH